MLSLDSVSPEEYNGLVVSKYRIDPETGEAIDPRDTKPSHKYSSTQDLHQIGSRLKDTRDLLGESREALKDGSATKKRVKEIDNMIDKTIMPMLEIAASAVHQAANIVSPIGGSVYTHNREESRQKKTMMKTHPKEKVKLVMLDSFVKDHTAKTPVASGASKPTAKKARRSQPKRRKLPMSTPPKPVKDKHGNDCLTYGMGEFLYHLLQRKNGHERGAFITSVNAKEIRPGVQNPHRYVTASRSTVYKIIAEYNNKGTALGFKEVWNNVGRRPLLKDAELEECVAKMNADPTKKIMKDKVNDMIVANLKNRGGVPILNMRLPSSTLSNYVGEFASKQGVSLTDKSVDDTNARHTAERSLICSMALLIVVSMTHFYVTDDDDVAWRGMMKKLSNDERLLCDMVSDFHGNRPVRARSPYLIITVDDTQDFATEGTQPARSSEMGLVSKSGLSNSRTLSIKHVDDSSKMDGRRVKRHFMANGAGDSAPPVYIISGLTEYEMPNDDFLVLDVEGMCVGGYGVGGSTEKGYIILMAAKTGMEKVRFAWVLENIMIPFVKKLRKKYFSFTVEGGQIPEDLKAVFWCDGDNSQIDSIVNENGISLFVANGIIANKHNASRTGSEQAPDLNKVFPVGKILNKKITVVQIPSDRHVLKRRLILAFAQLALEHGVCLKKVRTLVDYFSKQPQVISRSHIPDNIVHGVVANGMVDPTLKRVPVFRNIIGTIRRVPTLKEVDLCKKSFRALMAYSYNHGMRYIPDSVFIHLGFPLDIDVYGNEKIRTKGILQENQQRCKCLTAATEVASRAKRNLDMELEAKRIDDRKKAKVDRKKNESVALVERLCKFAGVEYSEANVENCKMEHFANLKADEL